MASYLDFGTAVRTVRAWILIVVTVAKGLADFENGSEFEP